MYENVDDIPIAALQNVFELYILETKLPPISLLGFKKDTNGRYSCQFMQGFFLVYAAGYKDGYFTDRYREYGG